MSFNVFSLMAQKKINVGIILQASGRGNNKDLIFTVPLEDVHTATAILQENLQRFGATRVLDVYKRQGLHQRARPSLAESQHKSCT